MNQNTPRDVFLHLLAIITLIVSAVSFGVLVFEIINVYIPDVAVDYYYSRSGYLSSMRSALATLIIVFPVFIWVLFFLKKDILKNPEKRELKIRKWLLHLTLFAAALIIIGDLVALLRSYLEGELSQRFVLKVVSILFIAGSVFVHYLSDLKGKNKKFSWSNYLDWVVAGVIVVGVVGGFYLAGSPQNQRLVRFDERRISDLQTIQWQIVNYWQRKEFLPVGLEELNDPIGGFIVPKDPQTGIAYEYRVVDKLKFEICANFDTVNFGDIYGTEATRPLSVAKSGVVSDGWSSFGVWAHDKGRICFEREIDPLLYPPISKESKI